jgi:hypothetical protein
MVAKLLAALRAGAGRDYFDAVDHIALLQANSPLGVFVRVRNALLCQESSGYCVMVRVTGALATDPTDTTTGCGPTATVWGT